MGYNIGPKIGIDGEAAFRQQIRAINNEYKMLQAQTKALTAEHEKNNDQQGKLKTQTEQLKKQIEVQNRAIKEMEAALNKARDSEDANAEAITKWETNLYDAKATVANLEKELADTEDALRKMEDGLEDTGDEVSKFGDILNGNLAADAIWDGLKEGAELLKELGESAIEAAADIRAEGSQFEQTFGDMEQAATSALEDLEKKTGISATRIKGNLSTVYAFSKTMGADSEEALDIASRAMAAAADSAAYYDKTVEEATETIQAYIKGNYANDAALGIASTETTRNAAAMERYGKAFKELTESQKVDTLLAMVEAGNKASGAMGQAAREAGEWTNVNGELEDAWKQFLAVLGDPLLETVTPILQDITEGLREMAEVSPGEQLAEDMQSFVQTLEETEAAYNSTMASTLATATVAERYVTKLQALEQQGLNTAEAHAEYESVVRQLNAIMPELNLTIDKQTGLINQNTTALLGDIEAWKNAATTQAMYDKMKGQLEAYGKAQVQAAEASYQIDALEGKRKEKLLELTNRLNSAEIDRIEHSKVRPQGTSVVVEYYKAYDKAGNLIKVFSDTLGTAQTAELKLAKEIKKTGDEISGLQQAVSDSEAVLAGYSAEMDSLTAIMDDYREKAGELTDEEQKQQKAIADTNAALLELKEGYEATKTSTREMLDSSIGLWSEIRKESDWTAEKVLKNWRDQMAAFDGYSANLKKARDMGLSDGIIKALSDGSQESMQILNAIVNQSQHSVGEINAAFTDLGLAKDGTADILTELDTSLQEGYDKLVEDARKAGVEIVNGIAQAIADNSHKIGEALSSVFGEDYQTDAETTANIVTEQRSLGRPGSTKAIVTNHNSFMISQLPGEDGEALAHRVVDLMQDDYTWKAGGLGG